MASNTSHYNLVKPAYDESADVASINSNMDTIDGQMYKNEQGVSNLQNGLAIVANGNTHVAITSGQYVFVKNHGTLADGLYVATSNIAANATLSSSNLTLETSGGLNALNSKSTLKRIRYDTGYISITSVGGYTKICSWSDLGTGIDYENIVSIERYSSNFGTGAIWFEVYSDGIYLYSSEVVTNKWMKVLITLTNYPMVTTDVGTH